MSAPKWWIEAEGRLWGPYPAARLKTFKEQGRLGASTRVATSPEGPFTTASLEPALGALFEDPAPEARPAAEPTPARRALLILADAGEGLGETFETALGAHGETVRVRSGVWLVQAREGPTGLRNALSRRMRPGGRLLVVEAPLSAAAWFNLDGATDRALRRLWAGG